jgi:bifunctional DNase/RNase
MIPMLVRTVDHDVRSGGAVAMLLPCEAGTSTPLTLPLEPAEACTLSHELDAQATPRARAYLLLAETLAALGGHVAAVMLEASADDRPVARVAVDLPSGPVVREMEMAAALGLAVSNALPVLVSEHLLQPVTVAAASAVPEPFLRALEGL